MKNRKGFTLIEMLVVIAIIGILSAVVLTALGPSRNKAKDARIISDMNQVRALAEANYSTSAGYGSFLTSGQIPITGNPAALTSLSYDITTVNGAPSPLNVSVATNGSAYAAWAGLIGGGYYCVDSAGNSKPLAATPSAQVCQ